MFREGLRLIQGSAVDKDEMVKHNEKKHKHAKHVAKYCQLIIRHHFKFSKVVVIVDDDDANDVEVLDDKEEFSDNKVNHATFQCL